MTDYIEQLARQKAFDALSPAEQAAVLAAMPRERYEHLRAVLLAAPALDPGPPPSADLRARLQTHLAAKTRRVGLLNRRVPLWQAAAALVLAMTCLWFWKDDRVREVLRPVVQVRTDTVFLEKTLWRERVIVRETTVFRPRQLRLPVALAPEAPPDSSLLPGFALEKWMAPPTGTSLANEPALLDFFVQTK